MKQDLLARAGKLRGFLQADIWRIRARELPGKKSFLIRMARVFLLSFREFQQDKCQLRASALTFYSLLSVVPILAMAFGISKGFGMDKMLEKQILERFQDQQEVASRIIAFANSFLDNTKGGLIAGVGVALLFWTIIKVLGNIEESFNDIWGVKQGRSLGRKFTDYLSLMLIAPLLFVMSGSATVLITSQVTMIMEKISILGAVGPVIFTLLRLLPYVMIWLLFTVLYVMMPNTRVKLTSGLVGGIVAGTIYQLVQWVYINFQIGVSSYGAIYGSFAALPLLLVWMQLSWLVVLFGAEISFAVQNVETYEFEHDCLRASHELKRLLALRVTHLCVKNFQASRKAWTENQIAEHLEIPIRLVREIVFDLTEAGILSAVRIDDDERSFGYQPARELNDLTVLDVFTLLDGRGLETLPVGNTPELATLSQRMELFRQTIRESSHNLPLKDI